ncbi:hypothetical protein F0225_18680 [Vibrio pectenicida]|uniref:Lipid/polyisoprenoid-binding YceI-like domain-containing protein n=1 Tax=Vibrio pectenicida TaxID=62763 RepID=A0A7Y4A2N9_9VIBR|nr:hypothetical protein [Vibrio pectenicida]NOH73343.1 hypothetical protein [Vibrio pectenicida]
MTTHFFRVDYSAGLSGFALFAMSDEKVRGTDVAGLSYRGSYKQSGSTIKANVSMSIPAGTQLVTGTCPEHQSFDFPINFDTERPIQTQLSLPIGQISVAITPLP